MLKGIIGILLFIFFLVVFFLVLMGGTIYKALRNFKKAAQQANEEQQYRYRTETGRQRQQYSHRQQASQQARTAQEVYDEAPQSDARHTQTATGETIIDRHHAERSNKKIFDDGDGEYVEFEEA